MNLEQPTAKAAPESLEQQVAAWSATESEIREKVAATAGITVAGCLNEDGTPNPKKGRENVHRALMDLVGIRTGIENRRKELKAPILALGNLVDSEAKRLTALSQPRENELAADRAAYDAEEKRIAEEKRAAEEAEKARIAAIEQARIQGIADQIVEFGEKPNFAWLALASESAVSELLAELASAKLEREEAERVAREEREAAEAEAARVAKLKAEQDAIEAEARRIQREAEERELAATRERLRIEEERIKAENDAKEAAFRADLAKLKAEREEYERQKTEEQAAREAEALRLRQESEAIAAKEAADLEAKREAERLEALRPDMEKALTWLSAVRDAIPEFPAIANQDILHALVVAKSDILSIIETTNVGGYL